MVLDTLPATQTHAAGYEKGAAELYAGLHLHFPLATGAMTLAVDRAMPGCQSMAPVLKQGAARCADFVLLNKTDMLAERQLDSLSAIVTSLNPLAKACSLAACNFVYFLCQSKDRHGTVQGCCMRRLPADFNSVTGLTMTGHPPQAFVPSQVIPCQQARVDIPAVFGPQVRPCQCLPHRSLLSCSG